MLRPKQRIAAIAVLAGAALVIWPEPPTQPRATTAPAITVASRDSAQRAAPADRSAELERLRAHVTGGGLAPIDYRNEVERIAATDSVAVAELLLGMDMGDGEEALFQTGLALQRHLDDAAAARLLAGLSSASAATRPHVVSALRCWQRGPG